MKGTPKIRCVVIHGRRVIVNHGQRKQRTGVYSGGGRSDVTSVFKDTGLMLFEVSVFTDRMVRIVFNKYVNEMNIAVARID